MLEMRTSHPRPRRLAIVSLLLALQCIPFLGLAVFTSIVGISAMRNAAANHKATAGALSAMVPLVGSGAFLLLCGLGLLLAWGMRRQKSWASWGSGILEVYSVILEGFLLFIALASFQVALLGLTVLGEILAIAILMALYSKRQARAVSSL